MYYRPHLVNLSAAGDGTYHPFQSQSLRDGVAWIPRNWQKVSDDTGVGNPHKSSAEKGKRYAEAVTDKYVELFVDLVNKNIYK